MLEMLRAYPCQATGADTEFVASKDLHLRRIGSPQLANQRMLHEDMDFASLVSFTMQYVPSNVHFTKSKISHSKISSHCLFHGEDLLGKCWALRRQHGNATEFHKRLQKESAGRGIWCERWAVSLVPPSRDQRCQMDDLASHNLYLQDPMVSACWGFPAVRSMPSHSCLHWERSTKNPKNWLQQWVCLNVLECVRAQG